MRNNPNNILFDFHLSKNFGFLPENVKGLLKNGTVKDVVNRKKKTTEK